MTINFNTNLNARIIYHYENLDIVSEPYNFDKAMRIAEETFAEDLTLAGIDVVCEGVDFIATFERENEDFYDYDDPEDYYDDRFDEMGYDPYMGCFTDDC